MLLEGEERNLTKDPEGFGPSLQPILFNTCINTQATLESLVLAL